MAAPDVSGGPVWPPFGVPNDARVFPLATNSKRPPHGFMGAHHRAQPLESALLVPGPAASYGITLDAQFLLADCDRDDDISASVIAALPPTWVQRTRRGTHRLYRLPAGFLGGRNAKWKAPDGTHIGELKVNGYLVGPGSTVEGFVYHLLDARDPTEAPIALLDAIMAARTNESQMEAVREKIVDGERDNELTSFAGFYRRRGYTEQAIAAMLWSLIQSGVVEQPPGREIEPRDCQRIARSAAKWEAETGAGAISAASWVCGDEVALVGAPHRWWVRHFVPRDELVMLFGDGGVGKSTFASWLAAEVTRLNGRFVYAGVEEPFARFLLRAVLGGADRSRIYGINNASRISLPRDIERLGDEIRAAQASFLYFDSIYTHFPVDARSNAATTARLVLGPLAELAQQAHCTIMGVFHETKAHEYLGSAEMRNVGRYMLHAMRKPRDTRMVVSVDKTNFVDPGVMLNFEAPPLLAHDPLTGQVQLEEVAEGQTEPWHIRVGLRGEDIPVDEIRLRDVKELKDEEQAEGDDAFEKPKGRSKVE